MSFPGKLSILFLPLVLSAFLSSAQSEGGKILSQSGLSNPNVRCMDVDSDGYVWIGTDSGINRYDGTTFVQWLDYGDDGLRNGQIQRVLTDEDGLVWVATAGGVELIRDGEVDRSFPFIPGRILQMRKYDPDHILIGRWGGLYLLDRNTGELTEAYRDESLQYYDFFLNRDGSVWITRGIPGECIILGKDFKKIGGFQYGNVVINDYHEGSDGTVYLCTDSGIHRFTTSGQEIGLPDALSPIKDSEALFMLGSPSSITYIGIRGEGVMAYDIYSGTLRDLPSNETLSGEDQVSAVLAGSVILLSKAPGVLVQIPVSGNFDKVDLPFSGITESFNMFYPLVSDGGRDVLFLSNRGFYLYKESTKEISPVKTEGLTGNDRLRISLMDERDSSIWVMLNYDRLVHFKGDIRKGPLRLSEEWRVGTSECIWQEDDGTVCLLQPGQILKIRPDGRTDYLPTGMTPDFWFCAKTVSGKVYFLADQSVWLLGKDGIPELFFNSEFSTSCFYEGEDGTYWVGTSLDGLIHLSSDGSFLGRKTRSDGLPTNTLVGLTGEGGNIYAISRFLVTKIDAATMEVLSVKNYSQFVSGFITNNAKPSGGYIMIGTSPALIRFMPDEAEVEEEVMVHLDEVRVDGITDKGILSGEPLGHGHQSLSFFFSTLSFNPGYTPNYQCRLVGYDSDWNNLWSTPRANYSGLPGGKYRFEVKVRQPSGMWSDTLVSLPFRIKYPWWGSPLAFVMYLLALIGLVFVVVRYLTLQKINQEKLAVVEGEKLLAEQISQERMTFFTNVSHEFRTPLALIYGPVQDLSKSGTMSSEDMKLVGIIKKNADRMARLTDQLLDFNRKRDIEGSLAIMETDLSKLLSMILSNFGYMFTQKNLHVRQEFPETLPVYCDSEKVERVVFNLLSNAVKYTPEYGEVVLSASKDDDGMVRISVADSGIGISRDKMDKIFDRFERVGEKVSGELPSGFGIGLSYAKHLALMHKGDLTVASNDPIGSVFTFAFPYGKEAYGAEQVWNSDTVQEDPVAVSADDESTIGGKDIHVLVVEDNPDMNSYMKSVLEKHFSVTSAYDGEQAWSFLRMQAPDIIVSDVMMPYKDGYTLCKEIKNDPDFCHIPIVLLTAKTDMESQLHGLNLGADAYLSKPFESRYLLAVVENIISNRRLLQHTLSETPVADFSEEEALSPYDRDFLKNMYALMDKHLDEENFNVSAIALELGVSRTTLFTKIKALLGQSPQELLSSYRLGKAMELLKEHSLNVSEVAYKVGFGSLTGFSRAFKNKFGIPPSSV
ncbi:MAG: response regulator [Bacteroidales bacterium]|nr:response regulator [Bacteroidales bacterium]